MICPVCKAILENFDDTRYCSNCGNYIYHHQSDINRFSNRTIYNSYNQQNKRDNKLLGDKNQSNNEEKKKTSWLLVFLLVIIPLILQNL